jgi:hypothetical protein
MSTLHSCRAWLRGKSPPVSVSFALADPRGPSSKLPNLRLCLDPSVDFASDIVVWGSQRYRITAVPGNTTGYCLGLLYIEMRIR